MTKPKNNKKFKILASTILSASAATMLSYASPHKANATIALACVKGVGKAFACKFENTTEYTDITGLGKTAGDINTFEAKSGSVSSDLTSAVNLNHKVDLGVSSNVFKIGGANSQTLAIVGTVGGGGIASSGDSSAASNTITIAPTATDKNAILMIVSSGGIPAYFVLGNALTNNITIGGSTTTISSGATISLVGDDSTFATGIENYTPGSEITADDASTTTGTTNLVIRGAGTISGADKDKNKVYLFSKTNVVDLSNTGSITGVGLHINAGGTEAQQSTMLVTDTAKIDRSTVTVTGVGAFQATYSSTATSTANFDFKNTGSATVDLTAGTISGNISYTGTGTNALNVSGAGSLTGDVLFNDGTNTLTYSSTATSTANFGFKNTGLARVDLTAGTISGNISYTGTGTNTLNVSGAGSLTGDVSFGAGTNNITVSGGTVTGAITYSSSGTNALNVSGAGSLTGDVLFNDGTNTLNYSSTATSTANFDFKNTGNATVDLTAGTISGKISYTGTGTNKITVSGAGSLTGDVTFSNTGSSTVDLKAGTISGKISYTGTGTNALKVSGAGSLTGDVLFNDGTNTLTYSSTAILGAAGKTITFAGSGTNTVTASGSSGSIASKLAFSGTGSNTLNLSGGVTLDEVSVTGEDSNFNLNYDTRGLATSGYTLFNKPIAFGAPNTVGSATVAILPSAPLVSNKTVKLGNNLTMDAKSNSFSIHSSSSSKLNFDQDGKVLEILGASEGTFTASGNIGLTDINVNMRNSLETNVNLGGLNKANSLNITPPVGSSAFAVSSTSGVPAHFTLTLDNHVNVTGGTVKLVSVSGNVESDVEINGDDYTNVELDFSTVTNTGDTFESASALVNFNVVEGETLDWSSGKGSVTFSGKGANILGAQLGGGSSSLAIDMSTITWGAGDDKSLSSVLAFGRMEEESSKTASTNTVSLYSTHTNKAVTLTGKGVINLENVNMKTMKESVADTMLSKITLNKGGEFDVDSRVNAVTIGQDAIPTSRTDAASSYTKIIGGATGTTVFNANYNAKTHLSLADSASYVPPKAVIIKADLVNFDEINMGTTQVTVHSVDQQDKALTMNLGVHKSKSTDLTYGQIIVDGGTFTFNKDKKLKVNLYATGGGSLGLPVHLDVIKTTNSGKIVGLDAKNVETDSILFKYINVTASDKLLAFDIEKCLTISGALSGETCKLNPSHPGGTIRTTTNDRNILSIASFIDAVEAHQAKVGNDVATIYNTILNHSKASDMGYIVNFIASLAPINNEVYLNLGLNSSDKFVNNFFQHSSMSKKDSSEMLGVSSSTNNVSNSSFHSNVWGGVSYGTSDIKSKDSVGGAKVTSISGMYGQEFNSLVSSHSLGYMLGFSKGSFDSNSTQYQSKAYKGDITSINMGVYDTYNYMSNLSLKSMLSFTNTSMKTTRNIEFNYTPNERDSYSKEAKGSPKLNIVSLSSAPEYRLSVGEVLGGLMEVKTSAGLNYSMVVINSYDETGFGALSVKSSNASVLKAVGTVSVEESFKLGGGSILPKLGLGASYRLLNNISDTKAKMASVEGNIDDFTNYKPEYANYYISPSASVSYLMNSGLGTSLGVSGDINQDVTSMSLKVGVSYSF